jgi:hypothetical protein
MGQTTPTTAEEAKEKQRVAQEKAEKFLLQYDFSESDGLFKCKLREAKSYVVVKASYGGGSWGSPSYTDSDSETYYVDIPKKFEFLIELGDALDRQYDRAAIKVEYDELCANLTALQESEGVTSARFLAAANELQEFFKKHRLSENDFKNEAEWCVRSQDIISHLYNKKNWPLEQLQTAQQNPTVDVRKFIKSASILAKDFKTAVSSGNQSSLDICLSYITYETGRSDLTGRINEFFASRASQNEILGTLQDNINSFEELTKTKMGKTEKEKVSAMKEKFATANSQTINRLVKAYKQLIPA